MIRTAPILAVALAAPASRAEVKLAPLFVDHAVFQRDAHVPVWGEATPGERVTVSFKTQTAEATADEHGRWSVTLDPMKASKEPADLLVKATNEIRVSDVLVGDVWLCSGQSNMEWQLARSDHGAEEIAAANFPLIRQFLVSRQPVSLDQLQQRETWSVCSPETAGDFTGVGYFFAREIHRDQGVPIGLINSSWGGTPIEAWMSDEALISNPAFQIVFQRWADEIAAFPEKRRAFERAQAEWEKRAAAAKAKGEAFHTAAPRAPGGLWDQNKPSRLFTTMIAPVIPGAVRGVLWYQGETNGGRPREYEALLSAMMRDWRHRWGAGDFPFFVVQLPNYASGDAAGTDWARLREAQANAVRTEPNAAIAVTIDIGDPNDVHPTNKKDVGHRLALLARGKVYGESIACEGPIFAGATPEAGGMRVQFRHAEKLHARDGAVTGFELAGVDQKFFPAEGKIDGESVLVTSAQVRTPVAVRYAWRNAPAASLYNAAGLPAAPFRSDTW
ncbi:MAG TPA: sialate O-acetylesterase [Opitutaceae bacterium]|nr:sialate O-acetylesterase [Opitutaceae bacterium]